VNAAAAAAMISAVPHLRSPECCSGPFEDPQNAVLD